MNNETGRLTLRGSEPGGVLAHGHQVVVAIVASRAPDR